MNTSDQVLGHVRQYLEKDAGIIRGARSIVGKVIPRLAPKDQKKKFWTLGKKMLVGGAIAAPMAVGAAKSGTEFGQRDLAPPHQQPPGY